MPKPAKATHLDVEAAPGPSAEDAAKIIAMANQQAILEKQIAQAGAVLDGLTQQHKQLTEHDLPEAMSRANIDAFPLNGGFTLRLKRIVRASIPEDMKPKAFEFVIKVGSESLIKHDIIVGFLMGDGKIAGRLLEWLRKQPFANRVLITDKKYIEPSSLGKFVRDRLDANEEIPFDVFGVSAARASQIVAPKGKKDVV